MRKKLFLLLAFFLILQACSSPSGNGPDNTQVDYEKISMEIDSYCNSYISENPEMSGIIIGIWDKEINLEYTRAYGYLSADKKDSANITTLSRLASITKMLSTTIALEQIAKGELSLDDKVAKYFPEYTKFADVTLRMLMDMTSGIEDYVNVQKYSQKVLENPSEPIKPEEIIEIVHDGKKLLFTPGSKFYYSSTNTILLAMIVEKATGKKFDDMIYSDFIKKYNIASIFFPNDTKMPNRNFLHGMFFNMDVSELMHPTHAWSAGGLIGDIFGARKLVEIVVKGDMLPKELHAKRFIGNKDEYDCTYGLGLSNIVDEIWGHSGAMPGYRSIAGTSKDNKQTYVILFNYLNLQQSPREMIKKFREIVKKYS